MRAPLLIGELRPWDLGLEFGSGARLHAVLPGSLQLRQRDVLDASGLFWVNALNGLVPPPVGWFPAAESAPGEAVTTSVVGTRGVR